MRSSLIALGAAALFCVLPACSWFHHGRRGGCGCRAPHSRTRATQGPVRPDRYAVWSNGPWYETGTGRWIRLEDGTWTWVERGHVEWKRFPTTPAYWRQHKR